MSDTSYSVGSDNSMEFVLHPEDPVMIAILHVPIHLAVCCEC